MEFAEILGVDAVLITRINKVKRTYMVVHSSIEIGISAQMVDTRTGEILWRAEQTESDFQGIGKIPTGISAAIIGPIQFVTNKLNLHRMTSNLVNKLTAIVKNPEDAEKEETFEEPLIASTTTRDLNKIKDVHDLKAKWAEGAAVFTEVPSNVVKKNDPIPELYDDKTDLAQPKRIKPLKPDQRNPSHIHWTPRKTNLKPIMQKPSAGRSTQLNNAALTSVSIVARKPIALSKKVSKGLLSQYTIQVGAYKTKVNASQMVSTLSERGYSAYITPYLDGDVALFKVHVEKFNNKEKASEFANKFTNKENLSTFITTLDPR